MNFKGRHVSVQEIDKIGDFIYKTTETPNTRERTSQKTNTMALQNVSNNDSRDNLLSNITTEGGAYDKPRTLRGQASVKVFDKKNFDNNEKELS